MRIHRFALALAVAAAATAQAQGSTSAAEAERLAKLLQERQLDAIAAADPAEPGRFVAALHYPGAQLLVLTAVYPVPAALEQRIAQGEHREAYIDLQSAGAREGRFFVTDLQANGLRRDRDAGQPFDITYTDGANQVSYDGNWRAQKMTQADYDARFREEDARYARMLSTLAAALQSPATDGLGERP